MFHPSCASAKEEQTARLVDRNQTLRGKKARVQKWEELEDSPFHHILGENRQR